MNGLPSPPSASDLASESRRALGHLVAGKALGAGLGLLVTALMWRRLEPPVYGAYLALLSALELSYLLSAAGLSTVAQRHLPGWVRHAASPWLAMRPMAQLMGLRLLMTGLLLLGPLALLHSLTPERAPWLWAWLSAVVADPQRDGVSWPPLLFLWFMLGTLNRFMEEVQGALLMQWGVQLQVVLAHSARVLALLQADAPDLLWVLRLELLVAAGSCCAAVLALARCSTRRAEPFAPSGPLMPAWRVGLRFWWIQLLGLAWSLHTLRVALAPMLGPSALAVHGAAQALADAARNASPLMWMSTWLRAVMLRLYLDSSSTTRARDLALAVLKIGSLATTALWASWLVDAPGWLRWAIGAALHDQAVSLAWRFPAAPAPVLLLAALGLLIKLQDRHLTLSLWSQTVQQPAPGIRAGMVAALSAAAVCLLWPWLGIWVLPGAMLVAEAVWVVLAGAGLGWRSAPRLGRRWHQARRWWSVWGILRQTLAAVSGAALARIGLELAGIPRTEATALLLAQTIGACAGVAWAASRWPVLRQREARALAPHVPPWVVRVILQWTPRIGRTAP